MRDLTSREDCVQFEKVEDDIGERSNTKPIQEYEGIIVISLFLKKKKIFAGKIYKQTTCLNFSWNPDTWSQQQHGLEQFKSSSLIKKKMN